MSSPLAYVAPSKILERISMGRELMLAMMGGMVLLSVLNLYLPITKVLIFGSTGQCFEAGHCG